MEGKVQQGRPCDVCRSMKRGEIEEGISKNQRISHISQRFGVSRYSIYRHIKNHASVEVRDAFQLTLEGDVASIASRIVDIADSVRAIREASASDELVLKAAAMELKTLEALAHRFGIDHEDTARGLEESKSLARAVGKLSREAPELRERLVENLVEEGAEGLADALAAAS